MSRLLSYLLAASVLFLMSCASSNVTNSGQSGTLDDGYTMTDEANTLTSGKADHPNAEGPSNRSLADMIGQLAGVQTVGNGSFRVRGASSFYSGTDPLFVLNGRAIGTDFSSIVNVIDPNEVSSLRVLKGPDASIYGARGGNGVIVIRTKAPN